MSAPKEPKFLPNGLPDGRGQSEGSRATRFARDDHRKRPGRTKGALSLGTIYRTVGGAIITLTLQNGKTKRISKAEGVILKQLELALKGDQRAAERFLEKFEQHSPTEVQPDLTALKLIDDEEILASAYRRGLLGPDELDQPPPAEAGSPNANAGAEARPSSNPHDAEAPPTSHSEGDPE
jgi:hypothetical protein